MRAGKEPINVEVSFKLDEKIGTVDLIGEEFSRVLINVAKNAFSFEVLTALDSKSILLDRSNTTCCIAFINVPT